MKLELGTKGCTALINSEQKSRIVGGVLELIARSKFSSALAYDPRNTVFGAPSLTRYTCKPLA